MSNDRLPVPEGTVLDGKYQVGRLLGRGGMGVVMAAHHLLLDTEVALKFLTATEPELVARFSREARAAARIQSEHVARVLDVGALANGAPFMVMECLAGEDLSQILARGPLPHAEAVDYVLQACEAIAEAHALGIVHRDLKPANLFLTRRAHGRSMIKVLDFGISRGGARGMPTLTGSGLLGSPQYMSPEQWTDSRAVDSRSDLWSLGVVLYEMLAGRRPFDGESFPAIFTAIANDAPPPLPPGLVPSGLEEAVVRCLEKEKSQRFQDVASLARAIGPFGSPASRALLDRIAHFGTSKRTAIAETALAEGLADTAPALGDNVPASHAEAAVAATDLPVGGTVALPPSSNLGRPRAGEAAVGRPSAGGKPATRTPAPRKPAAPPASAVPVKAISLGLAAVGAIAVVAVIIVRVVASDHGKRSSPSSSAAEAHVTPAPTPAPTAPIEAAPVVKAAPPGEAAPPGKAAPPVKEDPVVAEPAPAPSPAGPVAPVESPRPIDPGVTPTATSRRTGADKPGDRAGEARIEAKPEAKTVPARDRERPRATARAPEASKGRPGTQWSAACSRLLARQSLGETLSKEDLALYMRECRR